VQSEPQRGPSRIPLTTAVPQITLTPGSQRFSIMANQEHLDILKQGVEAWNQWRKVHPEIRPDLNNVDLSNVDFRDADFSYANLSGANLSGANLSGANLSHADLTLAKLGGVNLSGTDLRHAALSGTDLRRAVLHRAVLQGAYFFGALLQDTNLAEAEIKWTIFADSDLSAAKGLETVKFFAPATIGVNTLINSKGQIPERFLRGCGLSDWEIESAKLYSPNLSNEEIANIQYRIHDLRVRRAFQINPLFISYSHSDNAFVDDLEKLLTAQGVRFWRDIHHAKAGRLEKQIDAAIHLNDVVLLVLSKDSTNSDWVEHEARKAREKEKKSGKDALCPVALDDSWKTCRWPARLREQITEYNILDFAGWHDASQFQTMFGKLLEGLNLFYK